MEHSQIIVDKPDGDMIAERATTITPQRYRIVPY